MQMKQSYKIAVFNGDGIGPEVMAPTIDLLDVVLSKLGDVTFGYEYLSAGAGHYAETGDALAQSSLDAARAGALQILPQCSFQPQ